MRINLAASLLSALAISGAALCSPPPPRPNIVFMLTDDQGYGDAGCNNSECKIPTPNIDRLAREGMRFTDAHSASSVCSPTRYGILTGRYPWRTRLQNGVVTLSSRRETSGGIVEFGAEPLIASDTLTVPAFLKSCGYHTAMVGKWHLGFWYRYPGGAEKVPPSGDAAPVGTRVMEGPVTRGFDFFAGYHHAREMRTWIEQDRVTSNLDSPEEMLGRITRASVRFIRSPERHGNPFFLYVAFNSPHAPIVPSKHWRGRSGINAYADYVMETDAAVGEILSALDRVGLAGETLVFFTSDNGCSPAAGIPVLQKAGHDPGGGLRGMKSDAWDGGHRVPFIVRWPGVVRPGSVSGDLICHNSLLATCADVFGVSLPATAGPDSFSILPVLEGGEGSSPTHPEVVQASVRGCFAIREGKWKYIACEGSGGWSEGGDGMPAQLYDMETDRAERRNLLRAFPQRAARMEELLRIAVLSGHTVPGRTGKNDVRVLVEKPAPPHRRRWPVALCIAVLSVFAGVFALAGLRFLKSRRKRNVSGSGKAG